MKNLLRETTCLAQIICEEYLEGDGIRGIDATCGNGHDTLWLAQRCDWVYAFDLQKKAINTAEKFTSENGCHNVTFINESHEKISEFVKEHVRIIMFNLGYLPGGDKDITTKKDSTIKALSASLQLLEVDGILSVMLYPGHPAGREERDAVLSWASALDEKIYHCVHIDMINQRNFPPEILFITKKK